MQLGRREGNIGVVSNLSQQAARPDVRKGPVLILGRGEDIVSRRVQR